MENLNKISLGIQRSGRLSEDSVNLIAECGIQFEKPGEKLGMRLKTSASNFPLDILYLRDDDIPGFVEDGSLDMAIVGENVLREQNRELKLVSRLGFGRCRLSIAIPKNETYTGCESLNGLRIATSYPRLLKEFLEKNNVKAEIHEISGSAEIAPSMNLADAICDLVSSGSTLVSNGLKEVEVLLQSEAVLVMKQELSGEKKEICNKLRFRISSVLQAKNARYVLLNTPNTALEKIISLLPGIKSPTVMPLAEEGWSSLHSVVDENDFWEVIEKVKEAGAEGILVLPIEKVFK